MSACFKCGVDQLVVLITCWFKLKQVLDKLAIERTKYNVCVCVCDLSKFLL